MKNKRSFVVVLAAVSVVGLALGAAAPAEAAWNYTSRFGYIDCYSRHPATQSYGVSDVTHQIEDGQFGGYYEMVFHNGNTTKTNTFVRGEGGGSASWVTYGYTDYWMQTATPYCA